MKLTKITDKENLKSIQIIKRHTIYKGTKMKHYSRLLLGKSESQKMVEQDF